MSEPTFSGPYRIVNDENDHLVISVEGGEPTIGANLILSNNHDWLNENTWTMMQGSNYVVFVSMLDDNSVINIDGGSLEDGAKVNIWPYENKPSQQFLMLARNEGPFSLFIVHSAKCIDSYDSIPVPNAQLIQNTFLHKASQKWTLRLQFANVNICFKSVATNKYLGVFENACENGTRVHVGTEIQSEAQRFVVKESSEHFGYFLITHPHSGKVIEIHGDGLEDGAHAHLSDEHGGDNQLFRVSGMLPGEPTHIICKRSGKALGIKGHSTMDGTHIVQRDVNDNPHQQWLIELV